MKEEERPRAIYVLDRLVSLFEDQAKNQSVDSRDIMLEVQKFPWISSHPWSVNGVPKSLSREVFNVQTELFEERSLLAKTPEQKEAFVKASLLYKQLLQQQRNEDLAYLKEHASDADRARFKIMSEELLNREKDNKTSPYYGTYVPIYMFMAPLRLGKI